MASGGPLEFQLLLEILAALLLESGLPNTAQFACRCNDNRFDLRRKILNILQTDAGLPNTAAFAWRPGDSEWQVIRKWLIAIGGECKCGDAVWNFYQRFLEQLRINRGNLNTPDFAFRSGDTLLDILAKILANLEAGGDGEMCCGEMGGDWGFVTLPAIEFCDWGSVAEPATCEIDFGTV